MAQARPQAPQWALSVATSRQVPEQFERPAGHTHAPPAPHAPPTGAVHAPLVEGSALHAVALPSQIVVPVVWQPPVPADVHAPPVTRHVPPQEVWPLGHAPTQAPIAHDAVPPAGAAHAVPQDPQWLTSDCTARQTPPQRSWPGGQAQIPPAQVSPAAHARPQPPQFASSLCRSRQDTPHALCPVGHAHTPATQRSDPPQALPHRPQFARSVCTSTHAAPHASCAPGHAQRPEAQLEPVGHTRPQAPQWLRSLCVSRQVAPQADCPSPQPPQRRLSAYDPAFEDPKPST